MKVQNQTIKVTANESARTFTIRTYVDGKLNAKGRITPEMITELQENEVFVFGSNEAGIHGA